MDPTVTDAAANRIVKNHMLVALAVGLVPVPVVDVAAVTAIQLRMLSRLSHEYDVEFSEELGGSVIGSLVGAGGSYLASSAAAHLLLHLVPVAGWLANAATTAIFSSASTFAVGKVFVQHFSSGGTFLTFDPEKVREYYWEQLNQGVTNLTGGTGESFAGIKP